MIKIKCVFRNFLIYSVFLASATAVNASTTPAPSQFNLQPIIQSLELTEEQNNVIFDLIEEHQVNSPSINIENIIAAKKKQLMLVTQSEFDEAAMGELVDQVQAKEKELFLNEMRLKNSIYNVLTEKQKVKFKTSVKEQLMVDASQ
ncbi:hypothetical protein BIT28_09545 [Photobacterium proteolyticum]|uniref:Uncharacterized protein n=1 Tax=Photobacterium proteolyticum TaxID=1903952 RepID=A0A1Q9H1Q2_9GAMM|nr:Spy/CpxP family protein refolding chaperone [Photobacterium proteolyticum]OLQ81607.1 hypothetical protein BIT28_09545 [Photobacterium proteolyticum]